MDIKYILIVFVAILLVVIGCMILIYTQQHSKLQKVIEGKDYNEKSTDI